MEGIYRWLGEDRGLNGWKNWIATTINKFLRKGRKKWHGDSLLGKKEYLD